MSWAEYKKIIACKIVVIGKLSTLVGATVTVTDGITPVTKVFGADLVLTFEVDGCKSYTVSASTFAKVVKPSAGEYVEVELGGFDRLWILDRNKQDYDITGGFYRSNDGTPGVRGFGDYTARDGTNYCVTSYYLYSGKKINVTGYNTLWVQPNNYVFSSDGGYVLGLTSVADSLAGFVKRLNLHCTRISPEQWIPLDISELSGEYYISAYSGQTNHYTTIRKLFISKDKVTAKVPPAIVNANPTLFTGGKLTSSGVRSGAALYGAILRNDNGNTPAWDNNGAYIFNTPDGVTPCWLKLEFNTAQSVNAFRIDLHSYQSARHVVIEGSNDDTNWTQITTAEPPALPYTQIFKIIDTPVTYKYYKFTMSSFTTTFMGVTALNVYMLENPGFVFNDLNRLA